MKKFVGLQVALLLLAVLPLPAQPLAAQTASILRDIMPSGGAQGYLPSNIGGLTVVLGKLFFLAEEPSTGTELWVSDGTAAGTELLVDGCPGTCSGGGFLLGSTGTLSFWRIGGQVWRSDGTRVGTFALTGSEPDLFMASGSSGLRYVLSNGILYFAGCVGSENDCGVWRTDGTQEGTRLVKETGGDVYYQTPIYGLTAAGGKVYFGTETTLWVSDGTAAGTVAVRQFQYPHIPLLLTAAGGRLFFVAEEQEGEELWVTDGTAAGTRAVTRFEAPRPFSSVAPVASSLWMKAIGDRVYFRADDVLHGVELWVSDGTSAGTRRISDFGAEDPFNYLRPTQLETLGNRVVFVANDGLTGWRVWSTTGAPESTAAVTAACSGPTCGFSPFGFYDLFKVGGRIVFVGNDGEHGEEPWSTDGTPRGTAQLRDICAGACGSAPSELALRSGVLYFITRSPDQALWRTNGTPAGTRNVVALEPGRYPFRQPPAVLDGKVFFAVGTSNGDDDELWVSDGTPGGSHVVTDVVPAVRELDPEVRPYDLQAVGDEIVFKACPGGVWKSAGTTESTVQLGTVPRSCWGSFGLKALGQSLFFWQLDGTDEELWKTDLAGSAPVRLTFFTEYVIGTSELLELSGRLFFRMEFSTSGDYRREIWETDGTVAGTRKALDLPAHLSPLDLFLAEGSLYIHMYDSTQQAHQLWKSDGTTAGTQRLSPTSLELADDPQFTRLGSRLFFFAGFQSDELWKTDGTPAGTVLVRRLSSPSGLTAYHGALYFFASSGDHPRALWRSDGTEAGTVVVRSFDAPQFGNPPDVLALFQDRLFFAAYDEDRGYELWQSDGTAAGTALVRDIFPGPEGSLPDQFRVAGGRLFFAAGDRYHGFELWQSDGTEGGTRMVQDIAPQGISSFPQHLTVAGNYLYFTADDGFRDREVWVLPLSAPPGCQPSSTVLCLGGGRFKVEATWRDFEGGSGPGRGVPLTADTGYFWFFGPDNVEVVLKVLDGRGINEHHWVFYGALSSVEYALTVTDTQTGASVRYFNPAGQTASVGDVTGFGRLGAFSTKTAQKVAPPSPPALVAERFDPAAATGVCQAGPTRLCLNGGRFAVEVTWKTQGRTEPGTAVGLTPDTGYFWFFGADNVEVVLKVLDGRGINGKFWVFYGALSDVEYTLTVTDTQTGRVKTYANPQGRFASVGDTAAF